MAQVNVTIAGRSFRMACGDGEEAHLEALAQQVDGKINELRSAFGEIGDQRLTVMAAIFFADDVSETRKKIATLEADIADLRAAQARTQDSSTIMSEAVASAIDEAAQRIEALARSMR